jgi:hypothetical protein
MERQKVEIRIQGQLDPGWVEWFNGFSLLPDEEDESILTGFVPDQAALYGLIGKLRDLGIHLISVRTLEGTP